jgi:hypothetical protein
MIAFPPTAFRRINEEDDGFFYAFPRRVVHIDGGAIEALRSLYERLLPPGGLVLDLMASWRSHLPESFHGTVVGLGMNRDEMVDNARLANAIVHDLNREPRMPFEDAAFDAVVCAVSVQYLTRPVDVFREVSRTLRPGAPFVVSFSNRCFPEKAVALWRVATDEQHGAIVAAYFAASRDADGAWGDIVEWAHTPAQGDPLYAVWSTRAA